MSGGSAASTVRDALLGVGLVAVLLGGTFLYAGSWPPILVIESGSMMRCEVSQDPRVASCADPPRGVAYGRYGTIDPGDVVIQKRVEKREDVKTWAQGGPMTYGKPGDVIVFYPFNNTNTTPVIHRAMAWVDVVPGPRGREYHVEWVGGEVRKYDARGIYLPELGFDERAGFTPTSGYRPPVSGFITKGDNAVTNDRADQAALTPADRLTELVQVGWISGKARGEIPWFGLVKLTFATGKVNNANPFWMRVGNTFAPYDLWTMLGFTVVIIVLAPLGYDVTRAWREQRAIRRDLERGREREERARDGDVPTFEPTE